MRSEWLGQRKPRAKSSTKPSTERAHATQIDAYRVRYFLDARNLQTGEEIKVEIRDRNRFDQFGVGSKVSLRFDPVEEQWFDPYSPRNPPRVGAIFWSCVFLAFVVLSFCGLIHKRPAENKLFRFE